MKKISLLMLVLAVCGIAFSQNNTQTINWKAGESKHILVKFTGKEIESDKIKLDTTFAFEGDLLVKEELPDAFIVSMKEKNMLESAGSLFYKNLSKEITVTSFTSEISINKTTFSITQINQEDYNAAIQKSYDEILAIVAQKVPTKLEEATQALEDLKKGQQTNSITTQIAGLLLDAYKFKYSEKDTVFAEDPDVNAVNLIGFPGAKVITYVQPSGKKGTLNVVIERIYDADLYNNMMSGMTQQVSGTIGALAGTDDDSDVKNQMEEAMKQMMSMMNMKITDKTVVTRSETSNWPLKIARETNIHMMAGGSKSGADIEIEMEIE